MIQVYTDSTSLRADVQGISGTLTDDIIDRLAYTLQLSANEDLQSLAFDVLRSTAAECGVWFGSLYELYRARARGEAQGFVVPALNIRTLTYGCATRAYKHIVEERIGPVIFEIALSEQAYTHQTHKQYAGSILAGALKAGYTGPVFVLGDHYQLNKHAWDTSKEDEINRIEVEIRNAIAAGFYNIDIDGSTLVNLDLPRIQDQQKDNYEVTAHLTKRIRAMQPEGVIIAIGGEIGHIGGINSTVEDMRAFMDGYNAILPTDMPGLSKIAIQTGTHHGGTPRADGTVAPVDVAVQLHKQIGDAARHEYEIPGTVQHGASTLPMESLRTLVDNGALEVHLATGWMNCVYDAMSADRRERMYDWVRTSLADEKDDGWNDAQFIYKLRKKALGHFKADLWDMPEDEKNRVLDTFEDAFARTCAELRLSGTREIVATYTHEHR